MENYCAYLRKSRKDTEQFGEEDVLARHERLLLDTADRLGVTIRKFYREVVSGDTIAGRPVVQKLLSDVEAGMWTGVFAVEVERLARGDTIDQGIVARTFQYSDTKIITPLKIYDPNNESDEEFLEFGLFMSRREYKTIRRRMQRGRQASAQEGRFIGNVAPYGFERKKLVGEKGFTLVPHPAEAPVNKLINHLYLYGETVNGVHREMGASLIVRRLEELKIPTRSGGPWNVSTIRGILANEANWGEIRSGERKEKKTIVNGEIKKTRPRNKNYDTYPGRHEGIITKEEGMAILEKLARNKAKPIGYRDIVKSSLAGIVVCKKCGHKMVRRDYRGPKNLPDTLMCPSTCCDNIASYLTVVEDEIIASLKKYLLEYKTNPAAWSSDMEDLLAAKEAQLQVLENDIAETEKKQARIYDFLESGVYTPEVFKSRSSALSGELNALRNTRQTLLKEIAQEENKKLALNVFIPRAENLLEHYYELDAAGRNHVLKELLEKVDYEKTERNRKGQGYVANFSLHLFPRLLPDLPE